MGASEPGVAVDLLVALDYGQFHLCTAPDEDVTRAVDAAIAADGIAQVGGTTVVLSPHQNNFAMPLRVELWAGRPPDDLDDWQQAFEVHLDVSDDGLFYESPTLSGTRLPVPAGSYRVRITGRGFVAIGWPGSTEPGDEWRLQVWPGIGPDAPRALKRFGVRHRESPAAPERRSAVESAREAARRVNADIARHPGARPLLPLDGTAQTKRWIPGDPARVFHRVIDIAQRTSAAAQAPVSPPPAPIVLRNNDPERSDERPFDGLPTGPPTDSACASDEFIYQLQALFMSIDEPTQARLSINWHRIPTARGAQWFQDVLAVGSAVCFTFGPEERSGRAGTLVAVEHSGLPRVWTEDLCAIWQCNLATLD